MAEGYRNEVASYQDTPPRGAVFFHGQDLERGVAGQGAHGAPRAVKR
ncbi:hypothetical protein ACN28S_57965 [Cystobacter fuscus]